MHWTEQVFVENANLYVGDLEARRDAATEEVEDLLALLEDAYDHRPETVLDTACGIGRHVLAFAEAGLVAEGFDLSPSFIERARELAVEREIDDAVRFFEGDLREADRLEGEYDLVTNLYSSFGYYDDATNRDVLTGLRGPSRPGRRARGAGRQPRRYPLGVRRR